MKVRWGTKYVLGLGLLMSAGAQAATVTWIGTGTAGEWHESTNWDAGIVPGTDQADTALWNAALTGNVTLPIAPAYAVSLTMRNGGALHISADMMLSNLRIGTAGSGGTAINQTAGTVTSSGFLELGTLSGASYTLSGTGTLKLESYLTIGSNGVFSITGDSASSVIISNLTVQDAGGLKFVLGVTGVKAISVLGAFDVAETSRLTVDGSGYSGGNRSITLVNAASMSGSFAAGTYTVTGLGEEGTDWTLIQGRSGDLVLKITTEPAEPGPVAWTGAVDSNWNTAGNWQSGLVPGTETNELAVLSGIGDAPVVATPGESTNFYSVAIYDEASLKICNDMKHFASMQMGSVSGVGGGHVVQMMGATPSVKVAGDLRVGDHGGATSDSSYSMGGGSLAVAGELYIDKGTFKVDGPAASINAGSMTITTNGGLHFNFDRAGVSSIVVSDAFTVASGAKLTIDLRGYTSGGNVIELVKFGSMSGSFDPADITIIGLGGGTISYDAGSLNLTVFDAQEAQANTLWFIATGGTGTDPQDLRVNTGRRIRDLSSPYLSYSQASDGNDLVYSVSWSGSDFDGDGFNDVISFDLRVEGFSGSTYAYSTNAGASSMTALGTSAIVQSGFSAWGVGSGARMVAGDSLRLSVENLHSSAGHSHPLKGFVAFRFEEPYAGHTHRIIIGQGEGLDAVESNSPRSAAIPSATHLVLTSAGSAGQGWALGHAVIQFTVSALPDTLGSDVADYSTLPTGPSYRTEYAAQTNFTNFPKFSWDILPRWAFIGSSAALTDQQAQSMAAHHQVLSLSGISNFGTACNEDGVLATAAQLKSFNPARKVLYYRNTDIHFRGSASNALYNDAEWSAYSLDENGDRVYARIRDYFRFNHSYPEMRQWWIDTAVGMVTNPLIDGVFIDKAADHGYTLLNKDGRVVPSTDRLQMYYDLARQVPSDTLIVGNTVRNERPGGSRELIHLFQGTYVERWENPDANSTVAQSHADARCASIQQMREAAVKGKILMPAFQDMLDRNYIADQISAGNTNELIDLIRKNVELPLAYFLIVAEKHSYFRYQPDSLMSWPDYIYDPTGYVPELTRPLGAPLGPPVKNGYVYTRSFEHVDVWLNVETDEAMLAWDSVDSDGDGMSDLWEYRNFGGTTNAVASADPDGDGYSNLEEYIAGLNPHVFDLAISNFTAGASNVLQWRVVSGCLYNVYWSSNLLNGFTLVKSNALNGSFADSDHMDAPAGFYKLTVEIGP